MRSVLALVVACAAALVALAGDDGAPPPATKEYASGDKKYSLSLPAAWAVSPAKLGKAEMSLSAELPENGGHVDLELWSFSGRRDARAVAVRHRDDLAEVWKDAKILDGPRVTFEPTPQVFMQGQDKDSVFDQWLGVRVIRRTAVEVDVVCAKDVWPRVQDACLAALFSVKTTLPMWPEPPAGYRRVTRGGYEFHVHPDVPDADVDGVQKRLREAEAMFVKWHGPVEWSADAPFVVAVNPTLLAATRCSPSIDGHSYSGNCADLKFNRLSVVPAAKGEPFAAPEFAREAWRSLLDQAGFDGYPSWLELGESQAASAEAVIGKPLPAIPDGYLVQIPKALPRLDELSKLENPGFDVSYAMLGYVAFFRLGPKPWRDAFAAFQKEGASSHDWVAAEKKHLLSLDQVKLHEAAQGWLARNLTSVKPK